MRADRLLAASHKVCNHDLPNQMVILQTLLQLLQEESSQLSTEGREYVRRLQNATRRAREMTRFLKEIQRIQEHKYRPEVVTLEALGRDLEADLQRLQPQQRFAFEWQWEVPTIHTDRRALLQAIMEVSGFLIEPTPERLRLVAQAQRLGASVQLDFAYPDVGISRPSTIDDGMEVILARQWLSLCDARLSVLASAGRVGFRIELPQTICP